MLEIEGFILAGGASSRMGCDKARLRLGGETFAARIARSLGAITPHVRVVSTRLDSAALSLPIVPDIYAERGALGGLHAALSACRAPWAAVVSCDLPFASSALWQRLATYATDEFDAVAPLQADARVQPLCTLYRRASCLAHVEEMLRSGELRPRVLLQRVRTRLVKPDELTDLTDAERLLANINTPDDYRQAKAWAEKTDAEC
ncbi:MAG TPA: molybdenum cofactor guanylyltransferase [Pyrinomonadaceae bacterium]|jgi:molybdopterin-guanine dinucleotide biosynthesis protein A